MGSVTNPVRRNHQYRNRVFLVALLTVSLWVSAVHAETASRCEKPLAVFTSVQGRVEVRNDDQAPWQAARLNQPLCGGAEIRTDALSRAQVRLHQQGDDPQRDGTLLQLDEYSALALPKAEMESTWLDLLKGAIHTLSRTPGRLTIKTLFANSKVEGTEFLVRVDPIKTEVSVYEGRVLVSNDLGSVSLTNGEAAVAELNKPPRREILLKPRDAVQWALYYPPIIDTRTTPTGPNAAIVREALQRYQANQVPDAVAQLDKIPAPQRDAAYHTLRAGLLLSVGRVEPARKAIAVALAIKPNDSTALALSSIIALTTNDKTEAQRLAQQAVSAEPKSPVAHIAQSYARQSAFDLDAALESAKTATTLAPDNALAWARVAELQLSQGDLDAGEEAAEKARALDPTLARTQTLVGFAALTQIDTSKAKSAFKQAIDLDPADPLPRLGLGLAKIRKGDLEEGRKDIEEATNLDPDNALVRSYLGKAYYEEKRSELAEKELDNAKILDPEDPTPWFYDAIRKQTENRPIEALQDLQKSIALNDNRSVYRSKLSLDSDLAARSASLSRVYRDLGYEQLALVEGWKSVNTDPSDYSAHRLLADSYSARPRHELARVSELLQSQLLQPINVTPIQPQLAERNLFTLEGAGPAAPSFNEFNPLFTRNRFALQASGVVGSNSTYGDEVVHSGLWRNLSYSIGQYHYESAGFRANNDVQVDLVDGFVQASLTPSLSVQAEIRHREFERGDIDLIADGSFFSDLRLSSISDTYRAGLRYSFGEHSNLIASFIHVDGETFSQQPSSGNFGDLNNIFGNQGEIQYLFRSRYFSAVTGAGVAQSGFSPADDSSAESTTSHTNSYLYTYTHFPKNADWTLGLSVDSLDTNEGSPTEQANPKLGVVWRALPGTTVRMAAFRTLKRSLITNQTIEPTQVAGFNQIFDDFTLTDAWLYGIAIDQKFGGTLFGGLEFVARDITRPIATGNDLKTHWDERSYRAYVNWNITSRLAGTVSFHAEEFQGDEVTASLTPLSTTTYDGRASLRFFDPGGFFSSVEAVYANQWAEWPDVFASPDPIHNEFILINAGIGLRLPRRLGIIQVDVKNVFDERFNYQSLGPRSPGFTGTDGQTPPFVPDRTVFARITLAF